MLRIRHISTGRRNRFAQRRLLNVCVIENIWPGELALLGGAISQVFGYCLGMNSETSVQHSPASWRRRALELAAIITSILLSFFLEDLRQENEEIEKKDELVQDLAIVVSEDLRQIELARDPRGFFVLYRNVARRQSLPGMRI